MSNNNKKEKYTIFRSKASLQLALSLTHSIALFFQTSEDRQFKLDYTLFQSFKLSDLRPLWSLRVILGSFIQLQSRKLFTLMNVFSSCFSNHKLIDN